MPEITDVSRGDVVGHNSRTLCTIDALVKSAGAGLVGALLPIPVLKYIKIIPSNVQSITALTGVGFLTCSMVVLDREMDRCPPGPFSNQTK